MKKLFFIGFLFLPSWLYAEGPLFRHKDAIDQQEFENVYQDLRQKASNLSVSTNIAAGSTNYIQNTTSLQSGAVFFVASGTASNFNADDSTFTHTPIIRSNATASNQAVAYGQVQYLQNAVQGTIAASTNSTASSFVRTGLLATITPTSSSSRVKVTVSTTLQSSNASSFFAYATLQRGSTALGGANGFCFLAGGAVTTEIPCSMSFIDSPATTSATTYEVYMKIDAGGTVKVCGNANKCTIIVEELR